MIDVERPVVRYGAAVDRRIRQIDLRARPGLDRAAGIVDVVVDLQDAAVAGFESAGIGHGVTSVEDEGLAADIGVDGAAGLVDQPCVAAERLKSLKRVAVVH